MDFAVDEKVAVEVAGRNSDAQPGGNTRQVVGEVAEVQAA